MVRSARGAVSGEFQLEWQQCADKRDAIRFQGFVCTEQWPTTPGGRRLPRHPRHWEWEAQRHVRNLRQLGRDGDEILVGTDPDTTVDAAVLHLRHGDDGTRMMTRVEVGAVSMAYRGVGPPYLGDEIMTLAHSRARTHMASRSLEVAFIGGFIHVNNTASMRMAARHAWEPLTDPQLSGYVPWGRNIE